MKSKFTAYLLWFFFGILGVHRFYLGKIGSGIAFLLTLGVFGIGWFIDLFTLGSQVNTYNATKKAELAQQHAINAMTLAAASSATVASEMAAKSMANAAQVVTSAQDTK